MAIAQETAFQTLDSLQQRLQRVRFLLCGDAADVQDTELPRETPNTTSQSVASRLHALQDSFNSVLAESKDAQDIVKLQSQHEDAAPDMTQHALASLVLSHAPSYQATAARLTSLQDLPMPEPSSSANLIALDPRLQRALDRQQEQQMIIAQLRQQSVGLIGRWYNLGILGMDECWTEWEARLMDAETSVRRSEADKRREDEGL